MNQVTDNAHEFGFVVCGGRRVDILPGLVPILKLQKGLDNVAILECALVTDSRGDGHRLRINVIVCAHFPALSSGHVAWNLIRIERHNVHILVHGRRSVQVHEMRFDCHCCE